VISDDEIILVIRVFNKIKVCSNILNNKNKNILNYNENVFWQTLTLFIKV